MCKQFQIDIKTVRLVELRNTSFTAIVQEREFRKHMLLSDADNDGTLNFNEFKFAVKYARRMLSKRR